MTPPGRASRVSGTRSWSAARTKPGVVILDWRGRPENSVPRVHAEVYDTPPPTAIFYEGDSTKVNESQAPKSEPRPWSRVPIRETLIASAKAATLAEDRPEGRADVHRVDGTARYAGGNAPASYLDTLLAAGTVKTVPGMRVGSGGQLRATVHYVPVKPGAS